MKKEKFSKIKTDTKRGVASLYVVIFATIIFGTITLSFTRIIISEAAQSSNDDLSRSAYDSALAGVEDAKRAVNEYYNCLGGAAGTHGCNDEAREKLFSSDCRNNRIGVADYLGISYNVDNAEGIMIQESASNNSDQAYTCVVVSDVVPDYRGTLTSDTTTRVIPLGVKSTTDSGSSSGLGTVKTLQFEWYSQLNIGDSAINTFKNLDNKGRLNSQNNAPIPPSITLTLIKMREGASRTGDIYQANNTANLIYSTILLLPSDGSDVDSADIASSLSYGDAISSNAIRDAGDVKDSADKKQHKPYLVECRTDQEFACSVKLDVSGLNLTDNDTVLLIASLPYGGTVADFAVKMYSTEPSATNPTPIEFTGVQISVDSTGRTNQLFRRVEVRLDPADLFFPYPQYELELTGGEGNVLDKNFWITANCWYSRPSSGTNATAQLCDNNDNL